MPEPVIDPTTGQPVGPALDPGGAENVVKISKDEWDNIKSRLDVFERNFQQQPAPAQPAPPSGPTLAEKVSTIDADISKLNEQIDSAISEQRPIASLLSKRDTLSQKRLRLQIQHEDLDPIRNAGMNTINQLSNEITRGKMPHLQHKEILADYNALLNSLPVDQQMNPEVKQMAYNSAVGKNMTIVLASEKEKLLREQAEPNLDPPAGAGRNKGSNDTKIPKPKDILGEGAMSALREKGQTVDQYYRTLGYSDFADWWEKTGKAYHQTEEED